MSMPRRTVTAALGTDNSGAVLRSAPTCLHRLGPRSLRGTADELRVLGEHAGKRVGPRGLRRGATGAQLRGRNIEADRARRCIDADAIAVAHQANRAAHGGVRRNMSDHKPVAAAGKAAIGDQRHLRAEAHSGNRAGGTEHFPHSRTAARTLATNDDDVTTLHTAGQDRLRRPLLAVEYACTAFEAHAFVTRDF